MNDTLSNSSRAKISLVTKLTNLNISKEISKEEEECDCIKNTFNNIKSIKRGISKDTYTYYGKKK